MSVYCREIESVVAELETDVVRGLEESEAQSRRNQFGPNELRETPRRAVWRRVADQFSDLVVRILIGAALIAGFMGDTIDACAIMAIVLLNGFIGFFQEERAEQAIAALRRMSTAQAKVVRGGSTRHIPATELVVGDLIEFEAGDRIPADARLTEAHTLQIQEASLTGESAPVEKDAQARLSADAALGDRRNMVYAGTSAATGRARAVVSATGMQTELGRIAGLLDSEPLEPTPLQRRLKELGEALVWVCLAMVLLVFVLEVGRNGDWFKTFLVAVSLAVAIVPEGLPAVVTLTLAVGLRRMARRNALVRKLPSVETLGSVTVICSDKTGTLTRNEMTVRTVICGPSEYHVSGAGYSPAGEFATDSGPIRVSETNDLTRLLTAAARCNNARLIPPSSTEHTWQVLGDPTEGALIVASRKGGIAESPPAIRRVFENPFDSQRKLMSTVDQGADGSRMMYCKGAPEMLLPRCTHALVDGDVEPLTDARRQAVIEDCSRLAAGALRVLGFAYRANPLEEAGRFLENELVYCGLCGMIDPPREEAKAAVAAARGAGIRPIMITGDHPETARVIAQELGILSAGDEVVTGLQLERNSDAWLAERVRKIGVYARVSAEHKLRVVHAWRKQGEVVAMTGDGVNDAPAVKAADIGIAMGIAGTDVTKEASDLVLTDDNFQSIVAAVEEGRCIFENIQNVVRYLLTCNTGEVLFMLFAAVIGWPIPLAAIQILWINLITDGLPAFALALEQPDPRAMLRPPRPPGKPALALEEWSSISLGGALIAAATIASFWYVYAGTSDQFTQARTTAFGVLTCSQLLFTFSCRNRRRTLPELGLHTNPHLLAAICGSALLQFAVMTLPFSQALFDTTPLSGEDWLRILSFSLAPVSVMELLKIARAAVRGFQKDIAPS